MIGRWSMGLLVAASFLLLPAPEEAAARGVSAFMGKALDGRNTACFKRTGQHGIKSQCSEEFIVPLTVDSAGEKTLSFTSRATSSGAKCRVVANDRYGNALSATPFRNIPVDEDFQSLTTGSVSVTSKGVMFADCRMNSGAELWQFDYPQ